MISELFNNKEPMSFFVTDSFGVSQPAFELDCVITEKHTMSSKITSNPIDDDTNNISFANDHIIHNPITLTIAFEVGSHPYSASNFFAGLGTAVVGGLFDNPLLKIGVNKASMKLRGELGNDDHLRVKKAYETIEAVRFAKMPIQIYSEFREFQNMGITNFSIDRNVNNMNNLVGTISFQEMNFVSLRKVDIETPKDNISSDVNKSVTKTETKGTITPKDTEEKTERGASILKGVFG